MTRRGSILRSTLFAVLALGACGLIVADEPAEVKARAAKFSKLAKRETEGVRFHAGGNGPPFVLHPDPILRWTNPIVGTVSGGLYLWTVQGRPEVVASVFVWYSRPRAGVKSRKDELTDEFQSLALSTLEMDRDGQPVWDSAQPGVELRLLPDASPPAGEPARRLRQMRDLATRFSGTQQAGRGTIREVRLLPQPLYRYEGTVNDLLDGALFVFVQATDPQVILLIEARRIEGVPQWHYAFARMTHEQLRMRDNAREVWSVSQLDPAGMTDRHAPYTQFYSDLGEAAARPEGP